LHKDIWDKLAAVGPIISGVCIFSIGGFFTYVYNQQQLRVQEVQTVEKFLPRLAGDEQSKRAAILAISSLTDAEFAGKMAAIYASPGTASALQSIAQSGNDKDKNIASQALTVTLEKIADNQSKLKDVEQDLKNALVQNNGAPSADPSHAQDLPYNLTKLADFYLLQGQYDLAEPLLKRSLAIRQQMYGPDNPQVVDVLKNLAELYKLQGNSTEADAYLVRARQIEEKLVSAKPPKHPISAEGPEAANASVAVQAAAESKVNQPGAAASEAGGALIELENTEEYKTSERGDLTPSPTPQDKTIEGRRAAHGLTPLGSHKDSKRL
jgi:tetratricopeptide (TPR) repeat protein